MIDTNMIGDGSDPGRQLCISPEFSDIAEHPHEYILAKIFGILPVVNHPQNHMPYQVLVFINKKPVSMGVTIKDPGYQR
jgi:hypothetical protein